MRFIFITLFLTAYSLGAAPLHAQSNQSNQAPNPGTFEFYQQQATAYSIAGIYDSALVAYEKAYELDSRREEIYNPLTKKYVYLGLFDRATTRLRELYINHPEDMDHDHEDLILGGTCLMGFYEALRGDYQTALNFTEISVANSDQIGRYHCAFRVMTAAEKYDKAATYLDTLYSVRQDPVIRIQYAVWGHFVETKRGNTVKANQYLTYVKQIYEAYEQGELEVKEGPMTQYFIGIVYLTLGDKKKAIQELKKAYRMGNKQYYWWTNINPILNQLEDYPEYRQLMEQMKSDIDRMRNRYLQSTL